MSTDFERDVSAAFHRAADQLPVPRLDLDAIRRVGRRRRMTSFTAAALAAAVLAGGTAAGVLHLPSAPSRAPGRPGASASPHLSASSPPTQTASQHPSATSPHPSATGPTVPADAMADVRAFYSGYPAAARQGKAAVDAFVGRYVAGWYAPIAEALTQPGAPGDCFGLAHNGLDYAPGDLLGGQAIIVVSSSDSGQFLYAIVTADQSTGKITGFACASGGQPSTTAAYASTYASSLYYIGNLSWLTLRRQGDSPQEAVARIVDNPYSGGPESASPYLSELQRAAVWPVLTYDPLLCTSAGLPNVSVTRATVVAHGEAGVVELTPTYGQPIVAIWVLGAMGYAVASVACHQP
jgi:hypothetical protein